MNNSIRYSMLFLLLLLPATAFAQVSPSHPIDKALDLCTEKNPTTGGMVECMEVAYRKWDQELKKNYQTLMRKLKPDAKQLLKLAQLSWVTYRDKEFRLIDQLYDHVPGTMYIPMRYEEKMQIVKQRALALAAHLDILGEIEP